MRTKHVQLEDGSTQAPGSERVPQRPPSDAPAATSEPVSALRLGPRAGSPRELGHDAMGCGDTLSIPPTGQEQPAGPDGLPIGTALQRYILLERVGQGAMGVVYAAHDYGLDRTVAIKLLRELRHGTAPRRRLMREAQALARLSHPNVVAVHDIGSYRDQVFIAMEYVHGRTLRSWLEEAPRGLREVLAVFRAAGEGLAAAHAAGIVHRDFKPDNVLVDRHGRARVSDFGLASVSNDPLEPASATATAHDRLTGESSDADAVLTRTGMLFGTPAYMALEQHLGQRVIDPRADQFSFAVALYESACGVHPFAADTAIELADNIQRGQIQAPRRRVPGWLLRALLPALAADPERRYPSMAALLRKLRDPRSSRIGIAIVAGLVAIGLGMTAGVLVTRRAPIADTVGAVRHDHIIETPCQDASHKLEGVWDAARKQEISKALQSTRSPLVARVWDSVERELDRYASNWMKMRTEACEATRDGEQSQELLDLRIQCLDQRRSELRAIGDELLEVDAETIGDAINAPKSLRSLERCADGAALKQEVPPPDTAVQAAVEELRARDAHLRVRLATGQAGGALAEGRELAAAAAVLHYRPVQAEAQLTLARLLWAHGELAEAGDVLSSAIAAANAGRALRTAAESMLELSWVVGEEQGRYADGLGYTRLARGMLEGVRGDDRLEALLEDTEGVLWLGQRQLARARPHLERGLQLYTNAHGANSHQVSASLDHLGMLAQAEHRFDDAVQMFQHARQLAESVHGLQHSATLTYLAHEARALYQAGRHEAALATNQRGHDLLEEEDIVGVMFLANLGALEGARKQYTLSRSHLERALAITEKLHSREHASVAEVAVDLGRVLVDMGHLPDATRLLARAVAIHEKGSTAEHPDLAAALLQLGRAHVAAGQRARAVPPLERALSIFERTPATAAELTEVRLLLRRARRLRAR